MWGEFARCPGCGKIYAARPGKKWCSACTPERVEDFQLVQDAIEEGLGESVSEIAAYTGLPAERVEELVEQSKSLRETINLHRPCVKCRVNEALAGLRFCLWCRADLYHQLAEATDELAARRPRREYVPPVSRRAFGVAAELRRKRGSLGLSRLDPTPKKRMER